MRSWIFVIGVATMGVVSVFGFYFAIARANQRVELMANTPAVSGGSVPLKNANRQTRYYAREKSAASRCAACHGGGAGAPRSPFASRAALTVPPVLPGN